MATTPPGPDYDDTLPVPRGTDEAQLQLEGSVGRVKAALTEREPAAITGLVLGLVLAGLKALDEWLTGGAWREVAAVGVRDLILLLGAGFVIRGQVYSPSSVATLKANAARMIEAARNEGWLESSDELVSEGDHPA